MNSDIGILCSQFYELYNSIITRNLSFYKLEESIISALISNPNLLNVIVDKVKGNNFRSSIVIEYIFELLLYMQSNNQNITKEIIYEHVNLFLSNNREIGDSDYKRYITILNNILTNDYTSTQTFYDNIDFLFKRSYDINLTNILFQHLYNSIKHLSFSFVSKDFNSDFFTTVIDELLKDIYTSDIINNSYSTLKGLENDVLEEILNEDIHYLNTGYDNFDSLIRIRPGNMILLAARPSIGKTTFALNLVNEISIKRKYNVLFVSLEMSAVELIKKLIKINAKKELGLDSNLQYNKAKYIKDSIRIYKKIINSNSLYIVDTYNVTTNYILNTVNNINSSLCVENQKIDIIFIDYLQLLTNNDESKRFNKVESVSMISREIKLLAKRLNIPIIALSQLNRALENRQDSSPKLWDLRDSGSLEQDADIVTLLHNEPEKIDNENNTDFNFEQKRNYLIKDKQNVILSIAKNRFGPLGEMKFEFDKPKSQFIEIKDITEKDLIDELPSVGDILI